MSPEPLRVLIVDDSRIFRSALEEALKDHTGVRVVGSVWSGEKAVSFVRDTPPRPGDPRPEHAGAERPGDAERHP